LGRQGAVRRGRRGLAAVAIVAVLAGEATAARAQETPGEPPVVRLDEVVVPAPRAEAEADRTASATVVSAEQFAGEAKDVAALVATAPGVAVQEYGGLGQLATISIRGSTADGVLVLVDGIPLNTAAGGGVDLSSIPRRWISRIEVVRGVEGAHYGSGALGGVVNVITRAPEPGAWSAEAGGGSFRTFTGAADGALRADGWTVMAAAGVDGTGGRFPYEIDRTASGGGIETLYRENDAALRGAALAKASRDAGPVRLDALVQLSAGRRELPGLPPPPTADGSVPPPPDDLARDGRALLSFRVSGPGPGAGLFLAARADARLDALDLHLDGDSVSQRGGAGTLTFEASHVHGPGTLRATGSFGVETLSAEGLGGTRARGSGAAYAAEELVLAGGRLRVEPAIRAERVGPFSGLSGKLGASFRLAPPLVARASAGRTFRAPSFGELYLQQGLLVPNPDLRPEEGLGADAGLVLEGAAGFASANVFGTLYRDLIVYQPASFGRVQPFNAEKAAASGLEIEAATARVPAALGLSLSGAYTLLVTETLRGDAAVLGKDLPQRPRHRAYARASIAPGRAELHAEAHYVGRQFRDSRNVSAIPAALVWNAGGSLRIARSPAIRIQAEVRNVADDRRLEDPFGYPLPGRMVLVSLRAGPPASEDGGPP
jgi:vitamin B12 transporter